MGMYSTIQYCTVHYIHTYIAEVEGHGEREREKGDINKEREGNKIKKILEGGGLTTT